MPPISAQRSGGSRAPSSVPEKHQKATLAERKFGLLNVPPLCFDSFVWTHFRLKKKKAWPWSSEDSIKEYVKYVISDACTAAGISDFVEYVAELGIFGVRPDLWIIVQENGIPVGVVEIKTPEEGILKNENVLGQLYDCLLRLKSFYGIKHV